MKEILKNLNKLSKMARQQSSRLKSAFQKNYSSYFQSQRTSAGQKKPLQTSSSIYQKLRQYVPKKQDLNHVFQKAKQINPQISKQSVQSTYEKYSKSLSQNLNLTKKYYQKSVQQIKKQTPKIDLNQSTQHLKKSLNDLKTKSEQAKQHIFQNSQQIKKKLKESKQFIEQKTSQIKNSINQKGQKTFEGLKQKIDLKKKVKKSFNFIFWRAALLLGIVAFSYGIGTSIPKQMKNSVKEYMNNGSIEQQNKISNKI